MLEFRCQPIHLVLRVKQQLENNTTVAVISLWLLMEIHGIAGDKGLPNKLNTNSKQKNLVTLFPPEILKMAVRYL